MISIPDEFRNELERLEFLEQAIRYQDGKLQPDELEAFEQEITRDPSRQQAFIEFQLQSASLQEVLRREVYHIPLEEPLRCPATVSSGKWKSTFAAASAVIMAIVALGLWSSRPTGSLQVVESRGIENSSSGVAVPRGLPSVRLEEESHARFFGTTTPPVGSPLTPQQDYMLQAGLIRLTFPSGATAILEAPAMFRIVDQDCLAMETGVCSVHAPAGAEGFRVVTPLTEVVDRGTRFSVKVQDNQETEVHVIEGAADLYPTALVDSPPAGGTVAALPLPGAGIRLQDRQALKLGGLDVPVPEATRFNPESYRRKLPDRLVSYQASRAPDGTADELLGLDVQRGGRLYSYSADDLIPIAVTAFRGESEPSPNGHLAGNQERPANPQSWLEDRKLNTGLINFGGQAEPLTTDPVLPSGPDEIPSATPGLAIRFQSPVVNSAGPDLVLFEIQSFSNPPEGDPFHVTPIRFRSGLRSLTVRKFDLTMSSPEALEVTPFWLHVYPTEIRSLAELSERSAAVLPRGPQRKFRAIGVGIDLSELGFADGEEISELFIQHAAVGAASRVDPVLIAGLPRLLAADQPNK
ncbi:FecR domain-containing protein [Planctomicrobium sp. SH664]|uniref:FecR domain-containing protein n=1 Tax=Planctomicrobium sp. SH664 TaxID=3448125 RepID=UPI003F5BE267